MIYQCKGLAHYYQYHQDACCGCKIQIKGSSVPDRCVFTHGPEIIIWDLVSESEHFDLEDDLNQEERFKNVRWR